MSERNASEDSMNLEQLLYTGYNFMRYSPWQAGGDELVDIYNQVLKLERDLGAWRQRVLMNELRGVEGLDNDESTGSRSETVGARSDNRTYHTPAILAAIAQAGRTDVWRAMQWAVEAGALTLDWHLTRLERLADQLRFQVTRGQGRADLGNYDRLAPMVMEGWNTPQAPSG